MTSKERIAVTKDMLISLVARVPSIAVADDGSFRGPYAVLAVIRADSKRGRLPLFQYEREIAVLMDEPMEYFFGETDWLDLAAVCDTAWRSMLPTRGKDAD